MTDKRFGRYFKPGEWIPINKEMVCLLGSSVGIVYSLVWAYSNGSKGYCNASVATMTKAVGLSESAIKRSLSKLEKLMLIKRVGGGIGCPICYVAVPIYELDPDEFRSKLAELGLVLR